MEFEEIAEIEVVDKSQRKDVLVSIWCTAYNFENYIRDALEGFLNQKTDFNYEVVIFDDASVDGTVDIFREYQEKYPEIIKLHLAHQNTFRHPERQKSIRKYMVKHLLGKYVALCEGDDYWINEHKLQIQIDYMREHPECSFTGHNFFVQTDSRAALKCWNTNDNEGIVCAQDIIFRNSKFMQTATIVIKKELLYPDDNFPRCDVGDWPLQLYAMEKGTVFYFDKLMSVYRSLHKGSWSENIESKVENKVKHCLGMVYFLNNYDKYTSKKYSRLIVRRKKEYILYAEEALGNVKENKAMECVAKLQKELPPELIGYLLETYRIYTNLDEGQSLDSRMISLLNEHEHVFIFGTGCFADMLSRKLQRLDLFENISGYVSSKVETKEQFFMGKPVYSISDEVVMNGNAVVIVALHYKWEDKIEQLFKEYGIERYYAPYWIQNI